MRIIETDRAPQHVGPVPQAVESAGWVFVSALFGTDPATGQLSSDPREEADQLFANLRAILDGSRISRCDTSPCGLDLRCSRRSVTCITSHAGGAQM
jgi:enamine deaminase RidA (YjgF/YER057c/UK114 family)